MAATCVNPWPSKWEYTLSDLNKSKGMEDPCRPNSSPEQLLKLSGSLYQAGIARKKAVVDHVTCFVISKWSWGWCSHLWQGNLLFRNYLQRTTSVELFILGYEWQLERWTQLFLSCHVCDLQMHVPSGLLPLSNTGNWQGGSSESSKEVIAAGEKKGLCFQLPGWHLWSEEALWRCVHFKHKAY